MTEYPPGTVADIATTSHDSVRAVRRSGVWQYLDMEGYAIDDYVSGVRPLVVIDADDREQVERLVEAWERVTGESAFSTTGRYLQQALHEFANPKPAEPTDLSVRVWGGGTTWAKIASWWVPVAMDEYAREWDWLVERDDFRVI